MRSFAFGTAALISLAALSACADATPSAGGTPSVVSYLPSSAATSAAPPSTSAAPAISTAAPASTSAAPAKSSGRAKPVVSDLSQLKSLGIHLNEGVLIDVADDGQARWLQIRKSGVDFTGTAKTDSTMMSLQAAPVRAKNRVLIKPPFWNEDLGPGSCVADTAGAALKLETCKAGRAAQVWEVRPAGDSGQFELHGTHGVVRVDQGKITTSGTGRTGLQTVPFAN